LLLATAKPKLKASEEKVNRNSLNPIYYFISQLQDQTVIKNEITTVAILKCQAL
jgi:hypothetical protein